MKQSLLQRFLFRPSNGQGRKVYVYLGHSYNYSLLEIKTIGS